MPTYTVTIDVADFVPDGVAPRLAFVTFSRLAVDDDSDEIVTTAPVSVRVTQTPATQVLEAGVIYQVRGDGIAGVGTFYAQASADCSLASLRDDHQVDPATGDPLPTAPTVGAAIAAIRSDVDGLSAQVADFIAHGVPAPAVVWTQSAPASTWTVPHSLGRRPVVELYLPSGQQVFTDVVSSTTQVVATFGTPTAGYAVLT